MYLLKLPTVFVQIVKYICPNVHSVNKVDQRTFVKHHGTAVQRFVCGIRQQFATFGILKEIYIHMMTHVLYETLP